MHSRRTFALLGFSLLLTGCTQPLNTNPAATAKKPATGGNTSSGNQQVRALCSVFPVYLFTKNVVGDRPNVQVTLLLDPQLGCPHDYDLKPSDRKKIADADVMLLNGAGLEEFANELKLANPKMSVIDTSVHVATMEGECDHDHDHGDHKKEGDSQKKGSDGHKHDDGHKHGDGHKHDGHKHDHEHPTNPHFFSSPIQAKRQVQAIVEGLSKLDPAGAETYKKNGDAYSAKLDKLFNEFKAAAKNFKSDKMVTMHGVFDYLARDLDLEVACYIKSAHTSDPSAKEMKTTVEKIRESKAPAIFTEPQYNSNAAKVIAKEAGVAVYELDPVVSGPLNAPNDYYETMMAKNLATLQKALGK